MGSTLSSLTGRDEAPAAASQGQRAIGADSRALKINVDAKIDEWIASKKLAPRIQSHSGPFCYECPICFIDHAAINRTNCCNNVLCTDCFAQLLLKDEAVVCPFCAEPIRLSYSEASCMASGPSVTNVPMNDPELGGAAFSSAGTASTGAGHTSSMVFSSVEARKELEAEMYAHRHMAGDLEDIDVIDRRSRAMSHGTRRAAHLSRVGAAQATTGGGRSNGQRMHRSSRSFFDNSSEDEEEELSSRVQALPYLRSRGASATSGRAAGSEQREEWLALHDMLVSARHGEARIGDEDLSRLEERMLAQAVRQSLIDSGGPVAERTPSSATASAALVTPAVRESDTELRDSDINLSEASLASSVDLDEESLLELALAMSLADSGEVFLDENNTTT